MTQLLEQAIQALSRLSPDRQDRLARMVLQVVGEEQAVIRLSAEDEASFDESLAEEERGEFSTSEEIRAIWAKHSL